MFDSLEDHLSGAYENGSLSKISRICDVATHTIDVNSLFGSELYETGSFDLRAIETTSFGKILDALPLPAMLLDKSQYIVFANQSCARMTAMYYKEEGGALRNDQLRGRRFTDLVASPRNEERARALIDKTQIVLERAFETRKPRVAETILELADQRVWCRLHLRTVRIGSARYLLAIIEDVTSGKTREKMIEREQSRILEQNRELESQVEILAKELSQARERLRDSSRKVEQLQQLLKKERHKVETLSSGEQ